MGGKLNVYNLGANGVCVDRNPVELEDGDLTKAQNAIHDPQGSMGGLRKRRGLVKLNSVAAAGAVKGAIGVPIAVGTAGNEIPAVDPATRLFLQARRITATTAGWNTSSDLFVTSVTTGGPDGYDASATPRVPDYVWPGMSEAGDTVLRTRADYSGRPGCMYNNRLYYAGNDYTYQVTAPTIRMYDGSQDFLLGKIPNRAGVVAEAVIDMIVGGDNFIYFTTHDSGVGSINTQVSRIFQLDPESGAITQIGSSFPISPATYQTPFTLCWHQGRVWTRTHGGGISAASQKVYSFRIGIDSDWVLDATEAFTGCSMMVSYQGQLYMNVRRANPNPGLLRVRSTLGVYSTALTPALNEGGAVPTMVAFGEGNCFGSATLFGGNLYASYYNAEDTAATDAGDRYARIYKFDGTTWSVVFSPAKNDASCIPYNHAIVLGGKLFFVSSPTRTTGNLLNRILYTANGSSYTAITTSVLDDTSGGFLGAIAS